MRNEVDSLGRFVIPIKFRRMLNISHGDELDVTCRKGAIVIKKAGQGCIFCAGSEDLFPFEERMICRECLKKLIEKYW